jgi:polyribonucleotide nucleotidyltransferase
LPGKEGLVHVSEISDEFVEDVNSYLKEGDSVTVKLKDINPEGKYVLTMKI